jgi:hypothetical protein
MTKKSIDEMTLAEKADAAMLLASAEVIQVAKRTGTPVIIWKDGQVKEVPPEQLEGKINKAIADANLDVK